MLEKSNTWPEQVLELLNSCWRALLESCSNTQANVRSGPLTLVPAVTSRSAKAGLQFPVGRVHRQCQARDVHVHTLALRDTLDTRVLEVDAAAAMSREEAGGRGLCRQPRTERKDFLLTG